MLMRWFRMGLCIVSAGGQWGGSGQAGKVDHGVRALRL